LIKRARADKFYRRVVRVKREIKRSAARLAVPTASEYSFSTSWEKKRRSRETGRHISHGDPTGEKLLRPGYQAGSCSSKSTIERRGTCLRDVLKKTVSIHVSQTEVRIRKKMSFFSKSGVEPSLC